MARTSQMRRLLPIESFGTRATYHRPQVIHSLSTFKAFKKIPAEIWREILQYLDPEVQRADLLACSLSCRELVEPSQYVLFQKLTLGRRSEVDPILRKLVDSPPQFAQNIRHLHIDDLRNGQDWLEGTDIEPLLALCTGVVRLSVRSQIKRFGELPTSTVSTRICETGLLFCSLSSVHTVDISEGSIHQETAITDFLNGFPHLRKLVISTLTSENLPLSRGYEGQPSFSLQTLVLNYCADTRFLKWLSPALKELTSLKFTRDTALANDRMDMEEDEREAPENVGHNSRESFKQWMREIGENVRYLTLDQSTTWDVINGLDSFLSLLQFTPRVESLNILGLGMDLPPLFKTSLDLLGKSKLVYLKELALDCDIPTNDDPEFIANESDWPYIQTALMGSNSSFSNVKLTIHLNFITQENVSDVPEEFQDMYHSLEEKLASDLPLFSSRNRLHVTRCLRNGAYEWML